MSDMKHSALRSIVLISQLARHMHDYPQTTAPLTGDPMIRFAEQRSLSENTALSRAYADVAGGLHLIDVFTLLICQTGR